MQVPPEPKKSHWVAGADTCVHLENTGSAEVGEDWQEPPGRIPTPPTDLKTAAAGRLDQRDFPHMSLLLLLELLLLLLLDVGVKQKPHISELFGPKVSQ